MTEENITKVLELFEDTGLLDELKDAEHVAQWYEDNGLLVESLPKIVKLKSVLDKLGPKNRKRLHESNSRNEQIRLWSKAIRRYLLDKDAADLKRRQALFAQSILRREQEELRNQQAS